MNSRETFQHRERSEVSNIGKIMSLVKNIIRKVALVLAIGLGGAALGVLAGPLGGMGIAALVTDNIDTMETIVNTGAAVGISAGAIGGAMKGANMADQMEKSEHTSDTKNTKIKVDQRNGAVWIFDQA